MDCALYFDNYPRRVTQDRNEVLDHEAHNGKNSTAGVEDLNIKKKYTKLKLVLKELNKQHKAICDQRDELNDLLGQMMHKNVRLKVREDLLRDKNKKLKKKLQEKKLMMKKTKDGKFSSEH